LRIHAALGFLPGQQRKQGQRHNQQQSVEVDYLYPDVQAKMV
jgi:hypothetical protein